MNNVLDMIEIHEVEMRHAFDDAQAEKKHVLEIVKRLDTVEEKINAFNTFDYDGRFITAQADLSKAADPNSQISVAIDNVNHAAYLRFGSHEAVDTVNAVWWISKTGNKISNDFGDVLDPWSPRLKVQDFLRMTSEKQGDVPLEDIVPPHTHPEYQDEIDRLDERCDNLQDEIDAIEVGDGYDDSEVKQDIEDNAAAIATNASDIATNAAAIAENARKIDLNNAATGFNRVDIDANTENIREATFDIEQDSYRITDIEEFLGGVPAEVLVAWGQWAWNNDAGPPPNSSNACSDTLVIPEITEFWFNKKDLLSSDVTKWETTRPGDTVVVGKSNNFDTEDTGTYLIKHFEVQGNDGQENPNGQIYYMSVEFQDGSGLLQQSFGTRAEMRRNGMEFEDSVGGENPGIDLDKYLEKSGGEITGNMTYTSQLAEHKYATKGNGEPKWLSFKPGNYWEHVWSGSHQKMLWKFGDVNRVTISDEGIDSHNHKIKNLALPTTGSDAANRQYVDDKVGTQAEQVDQNRQDIALLKGALADKMEVQVLINNTWSFAGENVSTPRGGKFSADDWYFDKVTELRINKQGTSMDQKWTVVEVGDEIQIRYNQDPDQPINERYYGKYTVRNIIDNSGDILTVQVDYVSHMGTIVEGRNYEIRFRGARIPDVSARIDDQDKLIQDILERLDNHHKVVTWKFRGYSLDPVELNQGEFTIRKDGTNLRMALHRYDVKGKYWAWNSTKTHPLADPVMVTDPSAGGMKVVADGTELKTLQGSNPNFWVEVAGQNATEIGFLDTNREYIVMIPGLLPQFMNAPALGGYGG